MYTIDSNMQVTVTKLRQDLFRIVDRAIEGEQVEFTHRGVVLRIVPAAAPDKLARLARQPVLAAQDQTADAGQILLKEMEAEWQKDWAEL